MSSPLIESKRARNLVRRMGNSDTMIRWDKVYDSNGWAACGFWRSDEHMGLGSRSKELILPGCFVDEEAAGGIFAEHTIKEWCGEGEE
jgi:hypothetical protein